MRARFLVAAALTIALAATAATGASAHRQANKLTVWLQVDAQSGWPDVVAAVNSQFQKNHPGWTVDVQYQSWPDHLQKFDATLAAGTTPDVIEMGNTEMTKYMAAGAFAPLQKSVFQNSGSWLVGLAKSGTYGGKVYGVPYYAGSRVVTYRTDLFKKAGIAGTPHSLAQFTADAKKLMARSHGAKGFSPVYIAGEDWYVAMSFVYDYGGKIATTYRGKWIGTLDKPAALRGLAAYKRFFLAGSRASKTTIETQPNPYTVYGQNRAASMIGPSWFSCCVGKFKGSTAQFVMPSHVKGKAMPGFLGGSDLAVPASSGNRTLAAEWIADFTDTTSERQLQAKGNIPNATVLLGNSINERAAARSWFVPTAKHWVDVENGNILRNMLAQILTGKLTIKQAASSASDNIASVLNQA